MKYKTWPKRDLIKNYFRLPDKIFLLGLSPGALAVCLYLLCCEERNTYQCWPSYKTIGRAVKISANTARKYVCELEERGLITTERTSIMTKDGRKWNGCLRYHILPIQMSINQFTERQLRRLEVGAARQKAQAKLSRLCRAQEPSVSAANPQRPQRCEETCRGRAAPCWKAYRGRREAGEGTGAFAAPVRSQPPAVRAVSGTEADAFLKADISN